MKNRIAIAAALILSQFVPVHAYGTVEPLTPILSCITDPGYACIEKINVITSEGERIAAKLTSNRVNEIRTYAPASVLNANWQFYEVPGIKLKAGNGGRFLIRPFYFPVGNLDCFYTPCVSGGEYLEFAIAPITFEGKSDLRDLGYSYEIFFRVPDTFLMTSSNGRGMKTIDISKPSATEMAAVSGFKNYKLKIEPIAYSSYVLDQALKGNLVDKASEEADNGAVWFSGSKDLRMVSFGECKNLEAISVTGNVFYLGTPYWNPISKSIEVMTSAPHLKSDGSLNSGYFQAKITTAMAKCLWGVDLRNSVEANISLSYESGDKAQIESWSGQLVGDEYVLTASGFHFSNPKVSFLLKEKVITKEVSPTPSAKPETSITPQAVKAKKTINCKKGKITKKITGLSPKCPMGYKKKI
jgi:hypothetical protein